MYNCVRRYKRVLCLQPSKNLLKQSWNHPEALGALYTNEVAGFVTTAQPTWRRPVFSERCRYPIRTPTRFVLRMCETYVTSSRLQTFATVE